MSIDMSGGYEKAIREHCPQAEIAFDPFHVVRLGQRAVDQVRRDEWNAHERSKTPTGKWIKNTRWSLLKSPDKQINGYEWVTIRHAAAADAGLLSVGIQGGSDRGSVTAGLRADRNMAEVDAARFDEIARRSNPLNNIDVEGFEE